MKDVIKLTTTNIPPIELIIVSIEQHWRINVNSDVVTNKIMVLNDIDVHMNMD